MSDEKKIINISEIKDKKEITNTEYLLLLIEITKNKENYNLGKYSSTSQNFWNSVLENKNIGNIFRQFKGETLRKYWRTLRNSESEDKLISFIKENQKSINNPGFKLLQVINLIEEFFKSGEENLVDFLKNNSKKANKDNKDKKKESTSKKDALLNNKRNKENVEKEEIQKSNKKRKIDQSIQSKITQKEEIKENQLEEEIIDKELLEKLENLNQIINVFHKVFTKKSKREIFNVLYKTSGKIKDAYLYLINPEKFDKYAFIKTDDYILQNLRSKSYYQQLINAKGIESIQEREKFLKININDSK